MKPLSKLVPLLASNMATAYATINVELDKFLYGTGFIAADYLFPCGSVSSHLRIEKGLANSVPCLGMSIAMDRLQWFISGSVMSAGDCLLAERTELVKELREAGVKVRLSLPL